MTSRVSTLGGVSIASIALVAVLAGCTSAGGGASSSPSMPGMSMGGSAMPSDMPGMSMPSSATTSTTTSSPVATPTSTPTQVTLPARPSTMPKTAGDWMLEEHPDANTWHYHGPVHMTLKLVSGELAAKLATVKTVDQSAGVACVSDAASSDCYLSYPGGYVDVTGIDKPATVRKFLLAWTAALH